MVARKSASNGAALHAHFNKEGYVHIQPLLPEAELANLRENLERVVNDVLPRIPETQKYFDVKDDPNSLKQIQMLHEHDPYFAALAGTGGIQHLVRTGLLLCVIAMAHVSINSVAGCDLERTGHSSISLLELTKFAVLTVILIKKTKTKTRESESERAREREREREREETLVGAGWGAPPLRTEHMPGAAPFHLRYLLTAVRNAINWHDHYRTAILRQRRY